MGCLCVQGLDRTRDLVQPPFVLVYNCPSASADRLHQTLTPKAELQPGFPANPPTIHRLTMNSYKLLFVHMISSVYFNGLQGYRIGRELQIMLLLDIGIS